MKKCILRYIEVKANYFFRLMFFFILFSIIVFIIWRSVVWIDHFTSSLPLSRLIITGQRIYTTNHDIRQSVINSGSIGTFITQDVRSIHKKIKNFPWIKQVSVRKQWPDIIKIHIVEYKPVAYWNHIYMLTKDAIIFTLPEWRLNKELFPLLSGPSGREQEVLRNYYVFSKVMGSSIFKVKSVSMDHRHSWEIILDNGVKLILGRENSNIVRLEQFIKVYPYFLEKYINKKSEFISYIDLRYKSGFSIKKVPIVQYKN